MTNEEAINKLSNIQFSQHKDLSIKYALSLAIEALNKQIPWKPIHKENQYVCPNCDVWQTFDDDVEASVVDGHPVCWRCGQKLDWSGLV